MEPYRVRGPYETNFPFTCAALLFSSQALADECASASTQLEMNRCAAAQYRAADVKAERNLSKRD